MANNDSLILSKIKSGDLVAYEEVFRRYYPQLCQYAYSYLGNQDDAEDIVQHVFASLLNRRSAGQIRTSLGGYLYAWVHNECLLFLRRQTKQQKVKDILEKTGLLPSQESPDLDLESNRQTFELAKMQAELANLSPNQAQAIRLVHLHGQKYLDAAKTMGISVNTIKIHLRKALSNLRRRLSEK